MEGGPVKTRCSPWAAGGRTCIPRKARLGQNRGTDPLSDFWGLIAARPASANSRVWTLDRDDDERSEPAKDPLVANSGADAARAGEPCPWVRGGIPRVGATRLLVSASSSRGRRFEVGSCRRR